MKFTDLFNCNIAVSVVVDVNSWVMPLNFTSPFHIFDNFL